MPKIDISGIIAFIMRRHKTTDPSILSPLVEQPVFGGSYTVDSPEKLNAIGTIATARLVEATDVIDSAELTTREHPSARMPLSDAGPRSAVS